MIRIRFFLELLKSLILLVGYILRGYSHRHKTDANFRAKYPLLDVLLGEYSLTVETLNGLYSAQLLVRDERAWLDGLTDASRPGGEDWLRRVKSLLNTESDVDSFIQQIKSALVGTELSDTITDAVAQALGVPPGSLSIEIQGVDPLTDDEDDEDDDDDLFGGGADPLDDDDSGGGLAAEPMLTQLIRHGTLRPIVVYAGDLSR